MSWYSWIIPVLSAALQFYASTVLAAEMPQEVIGSWSQQKTCSDTVEFDQNGYTTFIDRKGHRCDVKRVVALKNQPPTSPAWRLELSCGRKFNSLERRINTVIRIDLDNTPHIMAVAEAEDLMPRNSPTIFVAIYFRCR